MKSAKPYELLNDEEISELHLILGDFLENPKHIYKTIDELGQLYSNAARRWNRDTATIQNIDRLQELLVETGQQFGFQSDDIRGKRTGPRVNQARRYFIERAREENFTLMDIGRFLNRHHCTIWSILNPKNTRVK